jgi:hypothetical protein
MGSFMLVWFEGDVEKAFADLAINDSDFITVVPRSDSRLERRRPRRTVRRAAACGPRRLARLTCDGRATAQRGHARTAIVTGSPELSPVDSELLDETLPTSADRDVSEGDALARYTGLRRRSAALCMAQRRTAALMERPSTPTPRIITPSERATTMSSSSR